MHVHVLVCYTKQLTVYDRMFLHIPANQKKLWTVQSVNPSTGMASLCIEGQVVAAVSFSVSV